jgi:hypothetical protein
MVMTLSLDALPLDGAPQVRQHLDLVTVQQYADRMRAGDVFPPISVMRTGPGDVVWDGLHRLQARRLAGFTDIEADVERGTPEEAIWRAIGANKTHGLQLSHLDKQRAVMLAVQTFPAKLDREIAEQVGCSTSLVSKAVRVLAKRTGVPVGLRGHTLQIQQKRAAVRALILKGVRSIDIRQQTGAHSTIIADIRRELGRSVVDYSRRGLKNRRARIEALAASGHTTRQIAIDVGVSEGAVRHNCRRWGVTVVADAVTRGTHRHDPHRILDNIVADAENLTEAADLITYRALTHQEVADALKSLKESREKLNTFIRRLMQEQHTHGEDPHAGIRVQDSSRSGRVA